MIGVIADDLTGAAELAAVGWRHGLRAEIVIGGKPGRDSDLVCLDTESRSCAAEEAGQRAELAAGLLQKAKVDWAYKKVDSVLRGQVIAEVEAVMKRLGLKRALLVPANPSLGRIVRNGRYFIRGKPIQKTEFAHDPEHPRNASAVLKLLGATRALPLHVCNVRETLPRNGILVGNATQAADLRRWAARRTRGVLGAGAAEFFGALLTASGHPVVAVPTEAAISLPERNKELFVCGTSSRSAREFVRAARDCRTPVFSLPRELVWGAGLAPVVAEVISRKVVATLEENPRVILNIGLPAVHERPVAMRLTAHLVQLAQRIIREAEVSHVYAEGGATAAQLARGMGWGRLSVVRELAPGVATLAVNGRRSLLLTIKPGSYLWPEPVRNFARTQSGVQSGQRADQRAPTGAATDRPAPATRVCA